MSLCRGQLGGPPPARPTPERECKICYEAFDSRAGRPKLLSCQHRVCARCLCRMADVGDSPGRLSCPFCRRETLLPERDVGRLQDDGRVLATLLSGRERARRPGRPPLSPEVLLCPGVLEPFGEGRHGSSDCLVVTLLEVPEDLAAPEGVGLLDVMRLYRPPSVASLPCPDPLAKCQACSACPALPRRLLMGLLCLLYFSSLPLGIYLLLVERLSLGIVLVSLVPATLILCILYSLCQCLRHEILNFPS
ncbi:PREDICTED: E3 ubiquitin-protein ligase RNF182-like [Gekko japonicus]|uniref:E3 ubiquitin-protein ligase RNF182 n=1 Tax=Gekko japonicus TaxID=146911 RepID=A0ABM1KE51_GEKJA|nr:PREDICTED: E3 ubiquitin-protein ligase RNF182-like [Gekko japonicus]